MLSLIPRSAQRRTETPNAVMTTLASPTLGPSRRLSLWRLAMDAGQQGPPHTFDSEQIWNVTEGRLEVALEDRQITLEAGDTLVIPAGVRRQITAPEAAEAVVSGYGDAIVRVPGDDAPRGTPAWIG